MHTTHTDEHDDTPLARRAARKGAARTPGELRRRRRTGQGRRQPPRRRKSPEFVLRPPGHRQGKAASPGARRQAGRVAPAAGVCVAAGADRRERGRSTLNAARLKREERAGARLLSNRWDAHSEGYRKARNDLCMHKMSSKKMSSRLTPNDHDFRSFCFSKI